MIGSDVPEVMEPREVRPSKNGGPYVTRTVFGWVVNGHTANFIKADVELSDHYRKYCNMEFNDSIYNRRSSTSLND